MFRSILLAIGLLCVSLPACATTPELYPEQYIPAARRASSMIGPNILYTVPYGRKAVVTDYYITNSTSQSIATYPFLASNGRVFRLGPDATEPSMALAHNYGANGTKTIPIVLNSGESYGISSSAAGVTIWLVVIEFKDTSPLRRSDIQTWTPGYNLLLRVQPNGSTVIGLPGVASINNPSVAMTGFNYINGSSSNVNGQASWLVSAGGRPSATNQLSEMRLMFPGFNFAKYVAVAAPGDQLIMYSDTGADGQYAWINYQFIPY